ncbi:unnamed protein product [Toxocara canis]|uniref:RING-type E3 ubiquitin transferase n=1 Tax=Toxocara canis TaxID=6265 RepID=A0A183V342_TOXCA|nr:unnamed protein product [Toxocara canis]
MLELHLESKTTKRLKFPKSNQTTKMMGFEKMTTKERYAYSTWDSQAVSDPSTNQAGHHSFRMQRTKHEASSSGQSGNVPHTDRGRGIGSDERAGQMPGGSGAIKNGRCVVKVEESDVHEFSEKGVLSLHKSEDTDGSDPCPICLRRCEDEAKLDSCDHHFCFEHICEWISLNPVCPMCKRDVHKIMHNIRGVGADQLFDEIERTSGGISPEWALRRQENVSRCSRYQLLLDSFDRPRAVVMADPAFRLLVYERHLLRRAIVDDFRAAGGARQRLNVSPTFFAEHDSEQRPRISAFVRREFAVLSQVLTFFALMFLSRYQ